MITGRDIIVVGQQPWDVEIGSNCKNIALEFSRHNRVLYVNSPLDRITLYRQRNDPKIQKRLNVIKKKENGLVLIQDRLWNLYPDQMIESINWIGNQRVFEFLNKINNRRFASSIQKAIVQLGFNDIILFNDNDMFRCFHLKEMLAPDVSIYYSRDFMLAVDYWKKHGLKLEPELIAKSDVCVANSTYLADYCKQYNPLSFYVGQGCELDMFTHVKDSLVPADMRHIPKPVIGYVGALQSLRLSIDILIHIAVSKPVWSLVLVGPEDEQFKNNRLHGFSNVYFPGSKPPESLPAYINQFDVCLNPQIVNRVTIGNYPRKVDEYLAMGKPVVATATEAMGIFRNHTYLAETKEDYVRLIETALQEDNNTLRQNRKKFASAHTWENSVKAIYGAINQLP